MKNVCFERALMATHLKLDGEIFVIDKDEQLRYSEHLKVKNDTFSSSHFADECYIDPSDNYNEVKYFKLEELF